MFDKKLLGTVEKDIFYTSDNDINRSLDVYYPENIDPEPWPVVVNIHGGSWSGASKDFSLYSTDLAKLGVLGVSVNYRLSPSVQAPVHVEDCKCAIRFLRANAERFNIDPDRVAVSGHSAGGHLAALVALTGSLGVFNQTGGWEDYHDKVKAAVVRSAPSNMAKQAEEMDNTPEIQEIWKTVMGTTDFEATIYREYSPMTYVSENEPPFLLVHGSADEFVNPSESENLHKALLHFGNDTELLIIPGGNHGLEVNGLSQDSMIKEKTLAFLLKHLK